MKAIHYKMKRKEKAYYVWQFTGDRKAAWDMSGRFKTRIQNQRAAQTDRLNMCGVESQLQKYQREHPENACLKNNHIIESVPL